MVPIINFSQANPLNSELSVHLEIRSIVNGAIEASIKRLNRTWNDCKWGN